MSLPAGLRVLIGLVATAWVAVPLAMALMGVYCGGLPPGAALRLAVRDNAPGLAKATVLVVAYAALAYGAVALWSWVVGR